MKINIDKYIDDLISRIPTQEESYARAQRNPNRLSAWYPAIKDLFRTPETAIVPITLDEYKWLRSDDYKQDAINDFTYTLIKRLEDQDFNLNRDLFIKTGSFSNKFRFDTCHVTNPHTLGEHALDVFYGGMLCSCPETTEFAVREFIHNDNDNRGSIYNGMPLNTEFRLFYDFDTHEHIITCNYWDTNTMLNAGGISDSERRVLEDTLPQIEADFAKLTPVLEADALPKLAQVQGLTGMWSVDFMHDGNDFWLIDMALAEQSYFYDKALNVINDKKNQQ